MIKLDKPVGVSLLTGVALAALIGVAAFAQDPRIRVAQPERQTPGITLEPGVNRSGQDYKSFELPEASSGLCRQACADDPNCKAYTYVKPGMQGARAICWLKSSVPPGSANDCCVSGVKTSTIAAGPRLGGAVMAAADLAERADLPMFVAANSGKVVVLSDMEGNGWIDYSKRETTSIYVDNSGILYSANGSSLIERENKLGGLPQTIDTRIRTLDFKFDSAGHILACSSSENCIARLDDGSGAGFVRYGSKGRGAGQFQGPQGVAVDSRDRIYVCDTGNHRIVRMDDMEGAGWTSIGSYGSGTGQFNAPWQIWVDKQDHIYVADMFNARIVRIDDMCGNGWAVYRGALESPRYVTTDQFNRIYIADPEADQVTRIDDISGKGKKVLQFKRDMSDINGPGKLAGPKIVVVPNSSASRPVR